MKRKMKKLLCVALLFFTFIATISAQDSILVQQLPLKVVANNDIKHGHKPHAPKRVVVGLAGHDLWLYNQFDSSLLEIMDGDAVVYSAWLSMDMEKLTLPRWLSNGVTLKITDSQFTYYGEMYFYD